MSLEAKWIASEKSECILKWTDDLHKEAKRLFIQDGTHGNMLFCFNEDEGLVSVNPVPAKFDHDQLTASIIGAVNEHNLYGIVFIGEAWAYFAKENDHTAFQLLDGEMNVSDLNDSDKKEILFIRMESRDGECLIFFNEIIRNENSVTLGKGSTIREQQCTWFV
jgi:hypothetical protein